jgi:hypothetical protein
MTRYFLPLFLCLSACTDPKSAVRIADLEKQTKDLVEQLKQQKEATSLDLQNKCSKQALAEFTVLGWTKEPAASFANHYNQKLNKCFIQIENTDTKNVPGEIKIYMQ